MTALEVYELTTRGGGTDFAKLIQICASVGPYCLIGGLAVNSYVEPVYTLDADIVMVAAGLPLLEEQLAAADFRLEAHRHSLNATGKESELRIQFTTDPRYEEFPSRSLTAEVLGTSTRIAALVDVTRGKLWAYGDPARPLSKRKKDELDLIRLAEAYPNLKALYPAELQAMIERG